MTPFFQLLAQKAMLAAFADLAQSELGTWQVKQKCKDESLNFPIAAGVGHGHRKFMPTAAPGCKSTGNFRTRI